MSVRELLARVGKILEEAGVQCMLTGSFASSVHGTPRATQDLDLVVSATRSQLAALLKEKDNIKIARRTVTKYRKALSIPSSSQRRSF